MDFSKKINHKSDFDVLLHITDANGAEVGFPAFDFAAVFKTSGGGVYEAGQQDGEKINVSDVSGKVRVAFDGHNLKPGNLSLEFSANVADPSYPDGKKLTVIPVKTDIVLVGTEATAITPTIELILPFAVAEESQEQSEQQDGDGKVDDES